MPKQSNSDGGIQQNRGMQLLRDPNEIYDKLSSDIGQNTILEKCQTYWQPV